MSSKKVRPGNETEPRINTRARAKAKELNNTINISINIENNLTSNNKNKRKKHLAFNNDISNEKSPPSSKSSSRNEVLVSTDNDITRLSKRYKTDSSYDNISLTPTVKTPEKSILITDAVTNDKNNSSILDVNISFLVEQSPRKSTKTPKKSPKNLSSPKGRLSKTPRKLSLTTDSPKTRNNLKTPQMGTTDKDKPHTPLLRKADSKISSVTKKFGERKFSKSPKIVLLRTPKLKAKKLRSPKLKAKKLSSPKVKAKKSVSPKLESGRKKLETPRGIKKTPEGKKSRKKSTLCSPKIQTPEITISPKASKTSAKTSKKLSLKEMNLKEPVVVLQRLPNVNGNLQINIKQLVPTNELNSNVWHNNDKSTSNVYPTSKVLKRKSIPGIENAVELGEPLNFSTPRLEMQRRNEPKPTSLSKEVKSLSDMIPQTKNSPNFETIAGSDHDQANETEAKLKRLSKENSTFDMASTSNKSGINQDTLTFENEKEEDEKNGTYELAEPKTPKLQAQFYKAQASRKSYSAEKQSPKGHKVRFASPLPCRSSLVSNIQLFPSGKTTPTAKSLSSKSKSKRLTLQLSRSNFTSNNTSINSAAELPQIRGKSNISINQKKTPLTFSGKKFTPKYSATKKVPNFTDIHKKIFEKSESLVDAKKRLQDRHTALATNQNSTPKRTTPKGIRDQTNHPTNSAYNRFGFKLRKNEAMDCIMNKRSTHSKGNKQETRTILKGVRTNRRFELQMKSRNIKL